MIRDRDGVIGDVLRFLDLEGAIGDGLAPVRIRRQADDLSDHYVHLVRAAMDSAV